MTDEWTISGGEVLTEDGFAQERLILGGGLIQAEGGAHTRSYDASGTWVLPGIIDVHGDAFERIIEPRPGVRFPSAVAFAEVGAQLLANGITTAFHGLTVSWEPGLRGIDCARELVSAHRTHAPNLDADTRLNIRWETFAVDHVDEILTWLQSGGGDILSINDHTTANRVLETGAPKLERMATRMGVPSRRVKQLIDDVWARRGEVPGAIDRICKNARNLHVAIFAHDEETPEDRVEARAHGVTVSEFPVTAQAAQAARSDGEHVVMGAPNVLRGGSHNGALCASGAVRAGHCSILASDYYYPAQRHAAFRLADDGILPLEDAWKTVSTHPAEAVGLTDRGRISQGLRADLLVIDQKTRDIRAVFVAGRKVFERG
ncbi:alpha-D-ribose 1-methylphosphonate 5-triphosphate diphosphatase [Nitratireductor kimnyeongensis]|uniref:Alpha-D-ribose 1-methylphosphonate 5-triphosphate diphosphatase n=1 Tax=Nitratireductor kimnyeongensis TaxID=430679 RepID=A0ABW0T6I4_9HYPH|nr:alpha-D-ribose 1-methylphosphonate 5-triphosphate diphosphatase [Nitratireductor kimnyeongensis]QZZ34795.1 alpha-D-ribose 1-methylphosphonate 5-triphosphate diphosphatase [Nitratireductor kimnyeongensis]